MNSNPSLLGIIAEIDFISLLPNVHAKFAELSKYSCKNTFFQGMEFAENSRRKAAVVHLEILNSNDRQHVGILR